jgi:hypothetical protein
MGGLFAVLCCAVLCCAVLCCAVLCCAVLCYAVLCGVLLQQFFGGVDEAWFRLVHVAIEAAAAPAIGALKPLQAAAEQVRLFWWSLCVEGGAAICKVS